jgi:ABC-2 type transport system permease protein
MKHSYNRLTIVKHVLQAEGRHLLRNAVLPVLLIIFFLSAIIALVYGRNISISQKATLDSLQAEYRQQYTKLYAQLKADTGTVAGKTDHIAATHPAVVDFRLHRSVYHQPAAFSLMAIGMSDMARYYYPVSVKSGYVPAEEKVNNPEHLLSGNFDVAFLFIYLLPLLAICLSYNLLSQEKEQGTLSLLMIQRGSITGILLIRLLVRYLILMAGVVIISITGILVSPASSQASWQELPAWLGVTGAYLAVWMGLVLFVLAWNMPGSVNLITMLTAWLLLLVVIPAGYRFMLNRSYTDHTAGNASIQREIEWETWDLPQKQLLDSFYAAYPQYRNRQAYDTGAASSRRAMAYYELVARRMQRVVNEQAQAKAEDMRAVTASYYYNPAVYTQALLNSIGRTDYRDYDHFRKQADLFRSKWKHFFYHLHFNDLLFSAATYKALPHYSPTYDPAGPAQWRKGILYLLLFAGGWLAAGAVVLYKNQTVHK